MYIHCHMLQLQWYKPFRSKYGIALVITKPAVCNFFVKDAYMWILYIIFSLWSVGFIL